MRASWIHSRGANLEAGRLPTYDFDAGKPWSVRLALVRAYMLREVVNLCLDQGVKNFVNIEDNKRIFYRSGQPYVLIPITVRFSASFDVVLRVLEATRAAHERGLGLRGCDLSQGKDDAVTAEVNFTMLLRQWRAPQGDAATNSWDPTANSTMPFEQLTDGGPVMAGTVEGPAAAGTTPAGGGPATSPAPANSGRPVRNADPSQSAPGTGSAGQE